MPGAKNGERPYLAPPKPGFLGPIFGLIYQDFRPRWGEVRWNVSVAPSHPPISNRPGLFVAHLYLPTFEYHSPIHHTQSAINHYLLTISISIQLQTQLISDK